MSESESEIETYTATSSLTESGAEAAPASPFKIQVRFLKGLTERQKQAFRSAADRWTKVIVADLPGVRVDGELIDDVLILAQGRKIDGPGKVLGQAGPTFLRPAGAKKHAFLPAKGSMTFDSADLLAMESDGTLNDVITHEMGHVLGIGTIWHLKELIKGEGTSNPRFVGAQAQIEYGKLRGGTAAPVPVESHGGPGTADSHWRDTLFGNELMTGFVNQGPNPMSRVTIASLADLGYTVSYKHAEHYALPSALELAEAGVVAAHEEHGVVLPIIPQILPEEAME